MQGSGMTHRVITANRLQDGAVIWLAAGGDWVEEIDRAMMSDADDAITAALASAKAMEAAGRVIGVYEVEVEMDPADTRRRARPIRLREQIRADGPTVAHG